MSRHTKPLIQMNIELHLRQQRPPDTAGPKEVQVFDGIPFGVPDFSDCARIARRFHELAETIRREEVEAEMRPKVKP